MGRPRDRSAALAALGKAPPTAQRRLVAALVAGLLAFLLCWLMLWLSVGRSEGGSLFGAIGAGVAGAVAGATTRVGRSVAYSLIAVGWLLLALLGAVVAALGGALG